MIPKLENRTMIRPFLYLCASKVFTTLTHRALASLGIGGDLWISLVVSLD